MSLIDEARTVRERIAERLRELEPLAREYDELSKLAAEMGIEPTSLAQPRQPTQEPERSPSLPAARGRRAAGRRRSPNGDDVGKRVLEAIRADPGKTVAEYAQLIGVAPTSLYRPVRELTNAGTIVKRARQLYVP